MSGVPGARPSLPQLARVEGATAVGSYFVSNYPPFAAWSEAALPSVRARLDRPPAPGVPLGLYVHIPFCRKRCDFCYYKVYTERTAAEITRYVEALAREAGSWAEVPIVAGRHPRFVYVGGGTPSYLSTTQLASLFRSLREAFPWDEAREVTFEAEPGTISEAKLAVLKDEGVSRLSLGVESFSDEVLEQSGRAHQARQIYQAYEAARRVGIPQVNLDLIAGMIGETEAGFDDAVRRTIALAPDSVTLYQMEVPQNTTLARAVRGAAPGAGAVTAVAPWPVKRARVARAWEALAAAGYHRSSAYTMVRDPSVRFTYRDELWRGADLLPLGLSSFGHLGGAHLQNDKDLDAYVARASAGELPLARGLVLTDDERLVRELILQLKLGAIDLAYFRGKFGVDPRVRFAGAFDALAAAGHCRLAGDTLALSGEALLSVDALLSAFYPDAAPRDPPVAATSAWIAPS